MFEIKLAFQNDEMDTLEAWVQKMRKECVSNMIAPVPTRKTDRASLLYYICHVIQHAINDHRALLEEKVRAARQARKG